jgi:hypothetical protein
MFLLWSRPCVVKTSERTIAKAYSKRLPSAVKVSQKHASGKLYLATHPGRTLVYHA